jgi:pimeloyl-ACP methyl ester carboxylesterase
MYDWEIDSDGRVNQPSLHSWITAPAISAKDPLDRRPAMPQQPKWFVPRWEPFMRIQIDDIRLFFDVEGSKLRPDGGSMREVPTLLLLHGGPGFDHSGFKPGFTEMAKIAQVVYLDLRGNGRSDGGPANKWCVKQWAEDVHSFCEALSIDRPVVLGHSLGGIVAMVYALRYSDHPSKLVLSSTSTQPVGERSFAVFERLGGSRARDAAIAFWTQPNEDSRARYEELCIPLYTRTSPPAGLYARAVRNPAMRLVFFEGELQQLDLLHQLAQIRCPTLIIAGEDDPITPIEDMEDIAAAMPSGLIKLQRFPNAGHGIYRDRPEAFFRLLNDFISS